VIEANERALERLLSAKKPAMPDAKGAHEETLAALSQQEQNTRRGFLDSMDEDFNSAGAMGFIFDLVRMVNQARAAGATAPELASAQETFNELTSVLGLQLLEKDKDSTKADAFIELLLELRQELRSQKNYELSDRIRGALSALHVVIEDSPGGSSWHWE
jgi:cysteinyl-tRNA synthetase